MDESESENGEMQSMEKVWEKVQKFAKQML